MLAKKNIVYILITIAFALIAFLFINNYVKAEDVSGQCYFKSGNCEAAPLGYDDDMFSGRESNPSALVMGGINSLDEFVSFIKNRLNNGSERDKIAAAVVINSALLAGTGENPEYPNKVRYYNIDNNMVNDFEYALSAANGVTFVPSTWRETFRSSFYDNSRGDVFLASYRKETYVIRFEQGNKKVGEFQINCGNMTMDFDLEITFRNLSARPTMTAPSLVNVGDVINFQSGRNITGYTNNFGNFNYTVERRINGGAWQVAPNGANRNFPINSNGPVNLSTYTYTPVSGDSQICHRMTITQPYPSAQNITVRVLDNPAEACTFVRGTTLNVNKWMDLSANGGSDYYTEPEQSTTGRLWDSISGAPDLNAKEWGYTERAISLNPSQVRYSETGKIAEYTATRPAPVDYPAIAGGGGCEPGYLRPGEIPPEPFNWNDGDEWCERYLPVTYSCNGSDYKIGPTTCRHDEDEYYWVCKEQNVAKGWSKSRPACDSWYSNAPCEFGTDEFWAPGGTVYECPVTWECPYGNSPKFKNEGTPTCERRCNGGIGLDRARLATPGNTWGPNNRPIYDGGDLNCYRPWQVTVLCQYTYVNPGGLWPTRDPANAMPTANLQFVVNADTNPDLANICSKNVIYWGGYVGDYACSQITTSYLRGFEESGQAYLSPNTQTINGVRDPNAAAKVWGTSVSRPTATQCFRTIARPYVNFDKTDVRALGGAGTINVYGGWSGSDGYGSKVDYAAFANQWIDGLRSNYINGTNVSSASSRTFANTSGQYGGFFEATDSTNYDAVKTKYSSTDGCNIDLSTTTVRVAYCVGQTVTISSNKSTGWTYNAPNSLYIVADTINISGNVTDLNGVALIARTVNTCSDGANGCANQLRLTGALQADNVVYRRAANQGGGSSYYCARNTRPGDLPGFVETTCGRYINPAEIVTYSPEFGLVNPPIQPEGGATVGKYDAIRSLPPLY
jgi:hypothetical protein